MASAATPPTRPATSPPVRDGAAGCAGRSAAAGPAAGLSFGGVAEACGSWRPKADPVSGLGVGLSSALAAGSAGFACASGFGSVFACGASVPALLPAAPSAFTRDTSSGARSMVTGSFSVREWRVRGVLTIAAFLRQLRRAMPPVLI